MGITELIPHLPRLWRCLKSATEAIRRLEPDIVVTIDSKGFNFRLLRAVKVRSALDQSRPTFVHYVGPSIWAYRGDHSKTLHFLEQHLDHLLLLFPFELASYGRRPPSTCVGPPIFEHDSVRDAVGLEPSTFSSSKTDNDGALHLLLLPGSRKQEVRSCTHNTYTEPPPPLPSSF